MKPVPGHEFTHRFRFTQRDVEAFAAVTGDHNPVHLDMDYAAATPFRKPIMHGFLSGSIFSKVFGTIFPGAGTVYLSQQLNFKRPMYVEEDYEAHFSVTDVEPGKGSITIACTIKDTRGKVCLDGEARLMNKAAFNSPAA